ncbi:hypothetical protein B5X24_HaOG214127 [Helicoverpa armigera]|uniref:Uncharacterized protein n=1 Tax=Helicoverpa armigera TaxID=29058 RepID=A0A2W1BHF9_HELAM|nr:hypothetical protein B5X24_HaOG214127 [Helicoverpa armigera]
MFQYDYEKRPPSSTSCESRATATTDWSRGYPSLPERVPNARRPLPPRPTVIHRVPDKTTVPLKVWIIASASCFAVCAALVLATVVITKWGSSDAFSTRELFPPEPILAPQYPTPTQYTTESDEIEESAILQKLSIFKNIVANREHKNLISKTQIHPLHDEILHEERNIKKKDKAVIETAEEDLKAKDNLNLESFKEQKMARKIEANETKMTVEEVPSFKPMLPELNIHKDLDLMYNMGPKDDYLYDDENLYDDYMQSNTMTSYLIEKVQELHDWVVTDPDFKNNTTRTDTDFGSLLKALNESLVEGNVTIVMHKLKDMYFGENYTNLNSSRKVIVTNSTDMVSFGILTLDVMLLHNIQLMAWENQEIARNKMLKDPDVFAFNALFLDPSKVESKHNEVAHDGSIFLKRLTPRQDPIDDLDIGKNLLENIMEVGMSTARAAIHLGRAYKNTRNILNQISNKELQASNIQNQLSRNIDGNTHALNHLQTSFDSTHGAASTNGSFYTELDCIWLLYCRNLVATTKLNQPYNTMARINGVALRMLTGELAANKALDTMIYELLTGWTDLKCNDMFPRCSKVNAATVVMDTILQSHRKSQATNRG